MELVVNITKLKGNKWKLEAAYDGAYLRLDVDDNPYEYQAFFNDYHDATVLSFQKNGEIVRSISKQKRVG